MSDQALLVSFGLVGIIVAVVVAAVVSANVGYGVGERAENDRVVAIIEQVVRKEMGNPTDKDMAALLASRVFIAAIQAKYRGY